MKKALVCIILLSLFLLGASDAEKVYVAKQGALAAGSLMALESLGRCFAANDLEAAGKLYDKGIVWKLQPGTLWYVSQRMGKQAVKIRVKGGLEECWTFPWSIVPYKEAAK